MDSQKKFVAISTAILCVSIAYSSWCQSCITQLNWWNYFRNTTAVNIEVLPHATIFLALYVLIFVFIEKRYTWMNITALCLCTLFLSTNIFYHFTLILFSNGALFYSTWQIIPTTVCLLSYYIFCKNEKWIMFNLLKTT